MSVTRKLIYSAEKRKIAMTENKGIIIEGDLRLQCKGPQRGGSSGFSSKGNGYIQKNIDGSYSN